MPSFLYAVINNSSEERIIDIGDFNSNYSLDFFDISIIKIFDIGDFNTNQTWYLERTQSIFSSLVLKSHLLAGGSLRLKNNLNVQNIIQSNLFLKNTINSYITISNDLTLLNSLIGSVEGSLVLPNRLTEPVTGNLGLKNKLTDKNDVEGSMTLRNRIDPQQEEYSGFVFSEEFLG